MRRNTARVRKNAVQFGRLVRRMTGRWILISTAFVVASAGTLGVATKVYNMRLLAFASIAPTASTAPVTFAQSPQPLKSNYARLAIQPEGDKMRRRLGERFLSAGREVQVFTGTLFLDSQQRGIRITRFQQDDGEEVTVAIDGGPSLLSWTAAEGAKSAGGSAGASEKVLVERIGLDSPDQFVLAQLRGASYYTVAHDVRPEEAGTSDAYSGPVWDVVRVEEPMILKDKNRSPVRLYYINPATGVIDKVVSREDGRTVEAEVSGWVNESGETIPTIFTWSENKQVTMRIILSSAGFVAK